MGILTSIIGTAITGKTLAVGSLVLVCALGVATSATGLLAYAKGKKVDKQRSDLVIATMLRQADERLLAETERVRIVSRTLSMAREGAERARQIERNTNQKRLDAERAVADGLRQQLAGYAAGGGAAGDDTLAACRERAASLGLVLGDALRAHAQCTAAAEDLAGDVRAVLGGWPRVDGAVMP